MSDETNFRTECIRIHLGPYHQLIGDFKAGIYGGPPLDASASIRLEGDYTIVWKDREKMMQELAAVLRKYFI